MELILEKQCWVINFNRPLINDAIEEDFQEPKDLSHLDYKYLKSFEGPLAKSPIRDETANNDIESDNLL